MARQAKQKGISFVSLYADSPMPESQKESVYNLMLGKFGLKYQNDESEKDSTLIEYSSEEGYNPENIEDGS